MSDPELTRESRPADAGGSRWKALLLVLVSAALVVGGATWYLGFRPGAEQRPAEVVPAEPHFQQWSTYVCLSCAAGLEVTATRRLEDDPRQVEERLLTRALARRLGGSALVSKCTHDWYLLSERYLLDGRRGQESAPNHSALEIFTETEAGAAALVEFAEQTGRNPERVWRSLGLFLTHRNPRVESRFAAFEHDAPELENELRAWLDDNFSVIERSQRSRGRGHDKLFEDSYRSEKHD